MTSVRTASGLLVVALVAALAGCAWARPPYADDPLLRRRPGPRPLQDLVRTASTRPATGQPEPFASTR